MTLFLCICPRYIWKHGKFKFVHNSGLLQRKTYVFPGKSCNDFIIIMGVHNHIMSSLNYSFQYRRKKLPILTFPLVQLIKNHPCLKDMLLNSSTEKRFCESDTWGSRETFYPRWCSPLAVTCPRSSICWGYRKCDSTRVSCLRIVSLCCLWSAPDWKSQLRTSWGTPGWI